MPPKEHIIVLSSSTSTRIAFYLVLGLIVGVPEGEVHGRGEEDPVDALIEDENEA